MRILIVDDEFASRSKLLQILSQFGDCNVALNGRECLETVRVSLENKNPYDLICLDIMMPELDGQEALKEIRRLEKEAGFSGLGHVKVVMITALNDGLNIVQAFMKGQCEAYLTKPVDREKLLEQLRKLKLVERNGKWGRSAKVSVSGC